MRSTLALVKSLFKLRTCNLNLSEENIRKGKFKVCLEFHIGNCAAPCIGRQSVEDYQENVRQIKQILRGRIGQLREHLHRMMEESASRMAFEEAQQYKEMLEKLDRFRSQSAVMAQDLDEADIFFLDVHDNNAILAYLKVAEGNIIQGFTTEVKTPTDEDPTGLMATLMMQIRTRYQSESPLIITNLLPEFDIPGAQVEIPTSGEKKRMLDLAAQNAHTYRLTRLKQLAITDPEQHTERLLSTVQKDLRLPVPPRRIECFDNSNFQGAYPVSALVCFVNGRPSRNEYRIFNIKTVTGPDDFATMREALQRRYSRLLSEGLPLPDLLVIDGGKGQLNAALEVLKDLNLAHRISIISIAKRLEEIYYPGDELPLYLDKKSETLRLLQHLRDEAHRFGLRHYRQRHKKTLNRSMLEDIPGIGRATAEKLLKAFKSVSRLRQAKKEEIVQVVGASRAQKVWEALNNPEE
jgi:excinuclease ABC subunit C